MLRNLFLKTSCYSYILCNIMSFLLSINLMKQQKTTMNTHIFYSFVPYSSIVFLVNHTGSLITCHPLSLTLFLLYLQLPLSNKGKDAKKIKSLKHQMCINPPLKIAPNKSMIHNLFLQHLLNYNQLF